MSGTRRFATDEQRKSVSYWRSNGGRRDLSSPIARILSGMVISLLIVFVAMLGYMVSGWSVLDSLYMVVITIFGVGYGEVHPVTTPGLRWLTIGLIVCGYVAIIYTVGGFAQLLIDGEFRKMLRMRRMQREIEQLRHHVVICGFGRMGSKLAEALATRGKPLIVIDQDSARVEEARSCGCLAVHGNATEEATLRSVNIENAGTLATVLSDDVSNLFITITAHEMNPRLEILARAEESSSIKKLRQVGASKVILPASIGADRLANMILRPSAETLLQQAQLPEGLNDDLSRLGLRLDELEINEGRSLIGGTLRDLHGRGHEHFLIIALRTPDSEVTLNPKLTHPLSQGDCVVILAHENDIQRLCSQFRLESELVDPELASATNPPQPIQP